ncbi:MAG: hypothetical protein KDA61_08375 [Planctomycetales bacterium]|nr:hypothetical protein [Planctomycetales bacterium]
MGKSMNRRHWLSAIAASVAISATLGCESPELPDFSQPAPSAAANEGDAAGDQVAADSAAEPAERRSLLDETPVPDPGDVEPVGEESRRVTANDPEKGRRSRAAGGYLGAVAGSYFYAKHQAIFLNIEHALDLFWGTEGRYPNSHEEFMTKIIQANNLQLPELMEGEEYVYVPEEGREGLHIRKETPAEE